MNELEKRLSEALSDSVKTAKKELNYNPSLFMRMFHEHGGLQTAKILITSKGISDGFAKLYMHNRLDLSVEAIILRDEWITLFTDEEIKMAEKKLTDAGYEYIKYENTVEDHNEGSTWSEEELKAAVLAYIEMVEYERKGINYNKSEINSELRKTKLKSRSKSSVEFRMQNISAVMENLCLPRIKGYLPAKNVGAQVTDLILKILEEIGYVEKELYSPTDNTEQLDRKVTKLIKSMGPGAPLGIKHPAKHSSSTTVFLRDPLVKAWVLKNANGMCEKCGKNGPFIKDDESFYLEVHHLIPLSDGGADEICNAVALCPNCHRELHYSKTIEGEKKLLISKLGRLADNNIQKADIRK